MNLSFIIQNKAAEVVRNLVRVGYGKVFTESYNGDSSFSPVMARSYASDKTPVLSSAALAHRRSRQYAGIAGSSVTQPLKRPLRVFQVIEKSETCSRIDRLVISGSFNEVCAELDRLVAKETALH